MSMPKKYISVVHHDSQDPVDEINPEYVKYLEDTIKAAKNCLVCAAIGDPMEVVKNTYEILGGDLERDHRRPV